jgi:hypothetical protein
MPSNFIPKENLEVGMAYKVISRNLSIAIWNGATFLGLRQKFHSIFIENEYHYDDGESVRVLEALESIPEDLDLVAGYSVCNHCNELEPGFDLSRGKTAKERWFHRSGRTDHPVSPGRKPNQKLFTYLQLLKNKYEENTY